MFEAALRADVPAGDGTAECVVRELDALLVEPARGRGPSWRLQSGWRVPVDFSPP